MSLPGPIEAFLCILAPQEKGPDEDVYLTNVRLVVCKFPDLHKELDVLKAIADSPCESLFNEVTCEVIQMECHGTLLCVRVCTSVCDIDHGSQLVFEKGLDKHSRGAIATSTFDGSKLTSLL